MKDVSKGIQREADERAASVVAGHNRGVMQRTYRKLGDVFAALPPERTLTVGELAGMFTDMADNLDDGE